MAIDIDAKMLVLASSRLARDRVANCDYQLGNAYGLAEFAPWPVDFVFMANSFHGAPDRERLARVVGEALKPGERFAIVNWHQLPREKPRCWDSPAARSPSCGCRRNRPSKPSKPAGSRARGSSKFRPTTTARFSKNLSQKCPHQDRYIRPEGRTPGQFSASLSSFPSTAYAPGTLPCAANLV